MLFNIIFIWSSAKWEKKEKGKGKVSEVMSPWRNGQ